MERRTYRQDYINHNYSGPRKSRKRIYGQMKRYHGEIKSRNQVWRKENKKDDNIPSISITSPFRLNSIAGQDLLINKENDDSMINDAVPKMNFEIIDPDGEEESFQHADILCNNCQNVIVGFRYKCITCEDYDLCKKCEMMETHSEHYLLRIPKPLKDKEATEIAQKLKQIFKPEEDITLIKEEDPIGDSISKCRDDESIQDDNVEGDNVIHLSEQSKKIIHSEVNRVMDKCKDIGKPPVTVYRNKRRIAEREMAGDGKRMRDAASKVNAAPEIAFADVNSDLYKQDSSVFDLICLTKICSVQKVYL